MGAIVWLMAVATLDQAIERIYTPQALRDAIEEVEEMQQRHSDLPGLAEALARLQKKTSNE